MFELNEFFESWLCILFVLVLFEFLFNYFLEGVIVIVVFIEYFKFIWLLYLLEF